MIKLITLRFIKILKSLIILFLTLLIKFIKTFSFIVLIKKYYSYFKIIFDSLKKFNHYYIFKYFIKSLAIFNIMLAGFTIFILTDFQYHDYITLIEQNLYNFSISDFFLKFKNCIKRIYKFLNDLFSIDNIDKLPEDENKIPHISDVKVENKINKNYTFYILSFILLLSFSIIIYKNIDFNPIITTITGFFSGFFRRDDDPDMPNTDDIINNFEKSFPGAFPSDSNPPIYHKGYDNSKYFDNKLKEAKERTETLIELGEEITKHQAISKAIDDVIDRMNVKK
jgi:hypothetical protein